MRILGVFFSVVLFLVFAVQGSSSSDPQPRVFVPPPSAAEMDAYAQAVYRYRGTTQPARIEDRLATAHTAGTVKTNHAKRTTAETRHRRRCEFSL